MLKFVLAYHVPLVVSVHIGPDGPVVGAYNYSGLPALSLETGRLGAKPISDHLLLFNTRSTLALKECPCIFNSSVHVLRKYKILLVSCAVMGVAIIVIG